MRGLNEQFMTREHVGKVAELSLQTNFAAQLNYNAP